MPSNRLIHEKSPYLLQHAHNPVDWYAWGPEAFEKARRDDKPIFLSIGYSTCHWCHVMERESFESQEVAEVLNRHFVPIKVDREERPDVDRIYMAFVQASSGGGGWPMSVWLTPDLKPFYGGTYFPPDSRYGRPGFRAVLEHLGAAWQQDRPKIVESSENVIEQLKGYSRVEAAGEPRLDASLLESGFYQFRRAFDSKLGGFGGAPKFPRPSVFNFLLRYFVRTKNEEAAEMVFVTLREMAKGGMNDQLGGGFHRYSVDARWFVPHFEKMLYDQAQLAASYLEAFQLSGDQTFAQTARDIFEYVLRDMTHTDGGFYSAEDADSVIDPAHPHEKGEGAFYIWSHQELQTLLGSPNAEWFAYRYGVEPEGNVLEDPHHEFTGKNILYQAHTIEQTARKFNVSDEHVQKALEAAKARLLEERGKRVRPHLDDKVLTSWNGLMISAFAKGAHVLGESRYLEAAKRAADFILTNMFRDGVLLRRFREGDAAIPGFLDDYAAFANGLVDLYEVSFEKKYVDAAQELARTILTKFDDRQRGAFFSTAEGDTSLVMRLKEDYDGAEPSGNSMAALLLLRLANMLSTDDLRRPAERTLAAFDSRMRQIASSVPQMLVALMYALTPPRQIVLAGDATGFRSALGRMFTPFHALLSPELHPEMTMVNGRAAAYVCENFACKLPITEPEKLPALLE
jgi:uncharacterized protein YyaL (SSP411 family)